MKEMLKKLFGGIKMTWPRLIVFAILSGVITALIALMVPEGNSIKQVAVTFEVWIVLAIIIVVNCEKPLEAACKTFVYFLISQPLVYLIQVPFNSMGWKLFGYYPYWFCWTVATFPGAFIAWYIKRDDWLGVIILSVALATLVWFGIGYLQKLIENFPQYLIATLFCLGMVPVLIIAIHHRKQSRLIASSITAVAFAVLMFLTFREGFVNMKFNAVIPVDTEQFPVTEDWTVALEDPENGTVELRVGNEFLSTMIEVQYKDYSKNTNVILMDSEGKEYSFPVTVEKDGNGFNLAY